MKTRHILPLFAIALLISACPYDGSVELSSYQASNKIDKQLIGKWKTLNEDGSFEVFVVSKAQKTVLHVIHRSYDEHGKKTEDTYYRIYASRINGVPFYTVERKDGKYNYLRLKWLDSDNCQLFFMADDLASASLPANVNQGELKKFIEINMDKDNFFDQPPMKLHRIKQ